VFLSGIGTVQAYNMDLIKTRVDGQITKVNFHEGQEIKEGDPLVEIDPRPTRPCTIRPWRNSKPIKPRSPMLR
jgi:multidrug efflux pump subunit AcrA (membrane-fusion protein)